MIIIIIIIIAYEYAIMTLTTNPFPGAAAPFETLLKRL